MDKRVLKIKFRTSGTKRLTDVFPDKSSSCLLVEGVVADDLKSSSRENICLENYKDMKRKKGPKKGQKKAKRNDPPAVNDPVSSPVCINAEDTICLDQTDDSRPNSEMDVEQPSVLPDKPSNISGIEADRPDDKSRGKAGHGRLRVKLKSSRTLEPHRSYSDVQTASDTDRSNQQVALELNGTAVEEDSTYSDGQTSQMQSTISEKLPRKAGSIRIKSSKGLGFSSEIILDKDLNKLNSPLQMMGQRNLMPLDNGKAADTLVPRNLQQREADRPYRDPRYNKKELSTALMVIKKVMKMEAAVPFNAPVNPVALGIPDYFDIIDTPMDFGTICHELEHGHKYLNSEDVFKDVQFIWENCYKYNNKGDYILDLMKRVKKNFMKYWMAAGLYSHMPSNGATDGAQIEDGSQPSQDNLYLKGKPKHKRRRHGIDRHKSDCLCAVCVVRRRRREREENSMAVEHQTRTSDANLSREFKLEESSPADNPCSGDATSSLDHSQENDANGEEAEKEEKMEMAEHTGTAKRVNQESVDDEIEFRANASGSSGPSLPLDNGAQEDSNQHSQEQEMELDPVTGFGDEKDDVEVQQQDTNEERKQGQSTERSPQRIMVYDIPLQQENQSILHICKSLFPSDVRSVWNGPHSLKQRHVPSIHDSPFRTALATFMKQ